MDWNKLLSGKRLFEEGNQKTPSSGRTVFESDVDRIHFSNAFRRLSRKTQVHPLVANDHVHTRLTHSLESSRVGRSLGKYLAQKIKKTFSENVSENDIGSIVQAACLVHDIGNPPFGHGGEEAMRYWFKINRGLLDSFTDDHRQDIAGFDGNAQGFRVVTQTENRLFSGGMRLTYATLGTFLKYPWSSRINNEKFSVFLTEEDFLHKIANEMGMIKKTDYEYARHPLSYLVEAADDICYAVMDLEDAVELKIVRYEDVEKELLDKFETGFRKKIEEGLEKKEWFRVNFARLRGPIFDFLVEGAIDSFIKNYDNIMSGKTVGSPKPNSLFEMLEEEDSRRKLIDDLKDYAKKNIFEEQKKTEIEIGAYTTIDTLLAQFTKAAIDFGEYLNNRTGEVDVSWHSKLILRFLGDHAPAEDNEPCEAGWSKHQCLRRVIDFVSGMTDNYATYVAKQLKGMGFSGVQRP